MSALTASDDGVAAILIVDGAIVSRQTIADYLRNCR